MPYRSLVLSCAVLCGLSLSTCAADKPAPVRTGAGAMTFETVPGWGLGEDGKSLIGPTHGGVVIDKAGNIYTSFEHWDLRLHAGREAAPPLPGG
jgi:hypothetical protein